MKEKEEKSQTYIRPTKEQVQQARIERKKMKEQYKLNKNNNSL